MENIGKSIETYLEKINYLVTCLQCDEWFADANEDSIGTIFNNATEIENSLMRDEAKKLRESLNRVYPQYDFTSCGDIVLEALLVRHQANEANLLFAVDKYVDLYSRERLYNLLIRLFKAKRLKVESFHMINRLKNGSVIKSLEAKTVVCLWEDMIAENNENFEYYVKDFFEKETSLFLECLKVSPKSTGHLILTVILRYLRMEPDRKMWFILLNNKHIEMTSFLFSQYPEFLDGLLDFFSQYASESEYHEGKSFSWANNNYPLNEFITIVHFLLTNDGLVGIAVNEFINRKITNFDDNFSFWLDVKSLL